MLVKTLIYLACYVCTVSAFGLGYSLKLFSEAYLRYGSNNLVNVGKC